MIPKGSLILISYGESDQYMHCGVYRTEADLTLEMIQNVHEWIDALESDMYEHVGDYLQLFEYISKVDVKEVNINNSGKVRVL